MQKSVNFTSVKFSGLKLKNLYEIAKIELVNSKEITRELHKNVITQNQDLQSDNEKTKTIKNELNKRKISNYESRLEKL